MTSIGRTTLFDATTRPRRVASATVLATVALAIVLLPLLAGLTTSVSPEGLRALTYWWHDARGWRLLARSLAFASTAAAFALLFATAVAFCLPRSPALSRFCILLTCLPLLVPSSLMGVAWIMALGRDAVVTNLLRHVLGPFTPTVYAWPVAAAVTGLRYLGVPVLLLASARAALRSSEPAERAFGLPRASRLRLHLSALTAPAIAASLLLVLLVHSDHILPSLFLVPTFGTELLVQYNALMDPASAASLAVVPALLALAVSFPLTRLLRRSGTWSNAPRPADPPPCSSPLATVLCAILLLLAIGIPLTGLVVRAASPANLLTALTQAAPEALHSLRLATLGGLLTLALAVPLALTWIRAHRSQTAPIPALSLLNLAVPGSLLALGLITFFSLPGPKVVRNGEVPLLLGYAARFVPVAVVTLFASWIRLSPLPYIAADVYRLSPSDRLLRITLPRLAPGLLGSLSLVMLLITAELEISLILVPPGPSTLGVRLYTLIHIAPDATVSSLAVDVLLLVVLAITFATLLLHVITRKLGGRTQ